MITHKNLDVWNQSIEFVKDIYIATNSFPKDETYNLSSQLRRAAVSVPANIAEGAARESIKEFIRFLYFSLGSLSEIETLLILIKKLGIYEIEFLESKSIEIRKKLINLIKYYKLRRDH